jgi:xanthine dehydrogenase accessory factor
MVEWSDLDTLSRAVEWEHAGHGVAIATVVETWGSSPRQAGSHLVVRDDGEFAGSVSGGCVENAVIECALRVIASQAREELAFGVTHERAWQVGLACGGSVRIYVEPAQRQTLLQLLESRDTKRPVVLAIFLRTGGHTILRPFDEGVPKNVPELLVREARSALQEDRSFMVEQDGEPVFLRPYNPSARLIVIGAVHAAQPLAAMAGQIGFEVLVVDPRSAFATQARFPSATLIHRWPEEALLDLAPDRRTAVVTLTHDSKLDDPALAAALRSDAFFIGALGSRRTHAARLERMRGQGFGEEALARIHGPVGLQLGARSPAEVAVSILAQMIHVLRQPVT